MTKQINPDSPLAQGLYGLFRTMGDSQREWQDQIGFGEEGNLLREINLDMGAHFERGTVQRERADAALRNYYIAKLALITTEVAEAIEEIRNGHTIGETYYKTHPDPSGDGHVPEMKPEGVPSELADIVIRVWSLCGEAGIDLGPMIVEKLNYNATRAQRHGGKVI